MQLRELLAYEKITIQCHDNPDADTLATGYAAYCYLQAHGIKPRMIYAGRKITKDNLRIFVEALDIPVENVQNTDQPIEGLLLTVDCQYGSSNVTHFDADEVIIIDHHQPDGTVNVRNHIISSYVSCSTVIWEMLKQEQFDLKAYPALQTALYYGIYTDSGEMSNVSNPVDKDMLDDLTYDKGLIYRLKNSNISIDELEIAGVAMIRTTFNKELHFAVVRTAECDSNILGFIADLVLQVSAIDSCVVFNVLNGGIKFSTRSCVNTIRADHLAKYISLGIGSGGGHKDKAGGFISLGNYEREYKETEPVTYFENRMEEYMEAYEIIDVLNYRFDTSTADIYAKKKFKLGYVVASDIIPVGSDITIRTLEGDLHFTVNADTYIMIGVKGEIYPIAKEKFEASYRKLEEKYTLELEYGPKAIIQNSGREYRLMDYARSCESTGTSMIYARKLTDHGVKIFTKWDRNSYMLGEPGDYIAARYDDPDDVYVIENQIFDKTYSEVQK